MSFFFFILLLSFLFVSFFQKFIGLKYSKVIIIGSTFFSFIFSCFFFIYFFFWGDVFILKFFSWVELGYFSVKWGFLFDNLTGVMVFIVIFISLLVQLYSLVYMEGDPSLIKFLLFLNIFTFFMLFLIISDNFLQMFFGWEGVGISSFLLINFWHTRVQANKSALKALFFNRVGDFFLGLAIFIIFFLFKSLDYSIVFLIAIFFNNFFFNFFFFKINSLTLISFCLMFGAIAKSAQFGLHNWLPDAMEGPTPVSALLHAATMVTAGVFLIVRCSHIIELSSNVLNFIMIFGGVTAIFGGLSGVYQTDLKRIIATSTTANLGIMFFCCGASEYSLGVYHLFNHAFFKALLFLGAGSIIHSLLGEQDIRKMGRLFKILPFTFFSMFFGILASLGFPFSSSYYSKDYVVELFFFNLTLKSGFLFTIISSMTIISLLYTIRPFFLVFFGGGLSLNFFFKEQARFFLLLPLFILSFFSLSFGYFFEDFFIGGGSNVWKDTIIISSFNTIPSFFFDFFFDLRFFFPLFLVFFGFFLYFKLDFFFFNFLSFFSKLRFKLFDGSSSFFDEFFINKSLKVFFKFFFKDFDKGIIEKVGPLGLVYFLKSLNLKIVNMQTGFIFNYTFIFILGNFLLIFFFLYLFKIFFFSLFFFSLVIFFFFI